MKTLNKTWMTGTLAAALIVGGAGALYSHAFAAESGTSASTDAPAQKDGKAGKFGQQRGGHQPGDRGGRGFGSQETATLLGIDEATLRAELEQNKTLAQIAQEKAGLSEADLIQKLVDAQSKKIDEAVTAGRLTQTQADEQKAKLSDRVKQEVTSTKPQGGFPGGKGGHHGGKEGFGAFGTSSEALTQAFGLTQADLTAALESGKSLADIADEHSVTRYQLIELIKNSMDDAIGKFIDHKRGDKPAAPNGAPADAPTAAPSDATAPAADAQS